MLVRASRLSLRPEKAKPVPSSIGIHNRRRKLLWDNWLLRIPLMAAEPRAAILTCVWKPFRQLQISSSANRKSCPIVGTNLMAQKKKNSEASSAKSHHADTATAAGLIDQLLEGLQGAAQCVSKLADDDAKAAATLLVGLRNPKLIQRGLKRSEGPLQKESVAAIFRELASGIQSVVQSRQTKVAFLGPLHSYSHLATLQHFGQSAELLPVRTIAAVFEEVAAGHVDAGVVPIENSTDGRIVDTLEMLTRSSAKLCGEIPLRIHHTLLGTGSRSDLKEVCSKPQAISQCREWLAHHLPDVTLTPMSSTTAAAQKAQGNKSVGAIASQQAGVEYGLSVLAPNIEDQTDNVTRFAVIGPEPAKRTGKDKTSLMFELPHQPGALSDAMSIFKRNRLNLTWIESFPKPNSPNEYLFFVELVGYQSDMKVRRALAALTKKTVRISVLGSYAQSAIE